MNPNVPEQTVADACADDPIVATSEWARSSVGIRAKLTAKLAGWKNLLGLETLLRRQIITKLLDGKITLTPTRDESGKPAYEMLCRKPYSNRMEVHVTPETAKKLKDLAATSGRAPEDIVEDAVTGYLEEVASVRMTLDGRSDDLKSGRVKPIDGEGAFRKLREKSERRRAGG
jgi:hypothetical protein